jgi:hypothetical protein
MTKYKISDNFKKEFTEFTKEIITHFQDNKQTIHKARNELKTIKYKNKELVVKAFGVPNIINQIAYSLLKESKACKSFLYGTKIADFTPPVVSYIEFYRFYLLKQSFLISEKFDYDFTIREPLLDNKFND